MPKQDKQRLKEEQPILISVLTWPIVFQLFCLFSEFTMCNSFGGRGPISGYTPCCIDRLTSIICRRQKQQNPSLFLYNCMQNSDYAFVQCCQTCFDQSADDNYQLNYHKTSEFLLTNPITAQCDDRRGAQWCQKFVHKRLNWTQPLKTKMDCSNVPIAFRLCRKSCGFCATKEMPAQAVYNFRVAKDAYKCYNPSNGLAQRKSYIKGYQKFSKRFIRLNAVQQHKSNEQTTPSQSESESEERYITSSEEELYKIQKKKKTSTHSPNDYFVVTDHDYEHYVDKD